MTLIIAVSVSEPTDCHEVALSSKEGSHSLLFWLLPAACRVSIPWAAHQGKYSEFLLHVILAICPIGISWVESHGIWAMIIYNTHDSSVCDHALLPDSAINWIPFLNNLPSEHFFSA